MSLIRLRENLTFLKNNFGHSHASMGKTFQVHRSLYGSWESGRSVPQLQELIMLAYFFNVTIDDLVRKDLSKYISKPED